jgi:sodium/potassium/calcium exchanger 6
VYSFEIPEHLKDLVEHKTSGKGSISGPLSAEGGVNEAQDEEANHVEKESAPVLASDGKNDEVDPVQKAARKNNTAIRKRDGLIYWTTSDLKHPFCRNCKALIDYQMLLLQYGKVPATKILLIVVVMILIWLLGTTAQDFFVPPLLYLSKQLKLPADIAGATLLALGNGAPDIFAVCTAAGKGDLPLSVSEMLGSNMFTLCLTGGCVILANAVQTKETKEQAAQMNKGDQNRLCSTIMIYILALTLVGFALMHGTHSIWKALALPCVYVLYLVVLWAWPSSSIASDLQIAQALDAADVKENQGPLGSCENAGDSFEVPAPLSGTEAPPPPLFVPPPPLAGLAFPKGASSMQKTLWAVQVPTYVVRWMCIPPVDGIWEPTRRYVSAASPIGMLIFCLLTNAGGIQKLNIIAIIGFSLLAVVASFAIFLGSDRGPKLPWFYPVLPLLALISAIVWLAVLAAEITALVEAIGFALEVPRLQLGFTAIAWGNSLADLLVCWATVRQGHASMAFAAVFAGPLIDDMIAFGLALILVAVRKGSVPVMCGEHCPSHLRNPLITSLVCVMTAVLVLAGANRFKGGKQRMWAAALFVLYAVFMVLILFVQKVDAPMTSKDQ